FCFHFVPRHQKVPSRTRVAAWRLRIFQLQLVRPAWSGWRLTGYGGTTGNNESGGRVSRPTARITHTLQHAARYRLATQNKEGPPPGRDSPPNCQLDTGGRDGADSTFLTLLGPRRSWSLKCRCIAPPVPFRLLLRISQIFGESSHESKILPFSLGDILRRVCVQYAAR